MKRAGLLLLAFAAAICGSPVFADPPTFGQVVSACGTPVRTNPQVGTPAPITVNPQDQLCIAPAGSAAAPSAVSLVVGTPITASSGNVAAAAAVATLPGVAAKTTYITGFVCSAAGSTAALDVTIAVTGTITGTLSYTFVFPTGATVAALPINLSYTLPVPASAANTAIVVTMPSGGTGNTNASCSATGYQL